MEQSIESEAEAGQWRDRKRYRVSCCAKKKVLQGFFRNFSNGNRKKPSQKMDHEFAVTEALSELYQPLISSSSTLPDIAKIILKQALRLTCSLHGYVSSIDPGTKENVCHTFTEMLEGGPCKVTGPDRRIAFPIGEDGRYGSLWGHSLNTGEPFFTNSPSRHHASAGLPAGHIPLQRFLSFPVKLERELVGQIAIANKDCDYTRRDLETISRLAGYYSLAIQRIRTQEALQKANDEMESHVRERTAELEAANRRMNSEINERKLAEEEKEKLLDQLIEAQKMEAIGTLVGGIAHDFNNILAAIIGYSELAAAKIEADHSAFVNIQEVIKAGNRARDLVKQILTFSRQGSQKRKSLDIRLVIEEALKLLRATIPKTIEIQERIETSCATVLADSTQMHQVIMNLCTNAYHAMRDEGGVLRVTLESMESTRKDFAGGQDTQSCQYVKLVVSDTGPGMNRATQERIFDPYYTTKPKDEGTGLGLAVVHGIVKSHGGYISVDSEPGKGAAFNVYLPCMSKTETRDAASAEAPMTGSGERILLVDDEETLVRMSGEILESLGYRVTSFTRSMDALNAFQAGPGNYDLVITDMTMPEMTGTRLARRMLEIRPDLPLVLCTGFSEAIDKREAKKLGFSEYIMKPVATGELARVVRKALDS
jgi:signal transduction histidine kinase/CheY-like chemotaxis protein